MKIVKFFKRYFSLRKEKAEPETPTLAIDSYNDCCQSSDCCTEEPIEELPELETDLVEDLKLEAAAPVKAKPKKKAAPKKPAKKMDAKRSVKKTPVKKRK